MGYYNTFVVKIWCNDYGEMIRGYIQHVSSQEQAYFLNNESMTIFMARHLAPPPNETLTPDNKEGMTTMFPEYWGDING